MQPATDIPMPPGAPRFSVSRFLRAVFMEGGKYWERGRLAYNGAQLLLTAVMIAVRWSRAHFLVDNLGTYIVFALIANLLYSGAYIPEALLQIPHLRPHTEKVRRCVLIGGTAFACLLAFGVLETTILRDPASD